MKPALHTGASTGLPAADCRVLIALSRGIPILSTLWVRACVEAGEQLEPSDAFVVRPPSAELRDRPMFTGEPAVYAQRQHSTYLPFIGTLCFLGRTACIGWLVDSRSLIDAWLRMIEAERAALCGSLLPDLTCLLACLPGTGLAVYLAGSQRFVEQYAAVLAHAGASLFSTPESLTNAASSKPGALGRRVPV